MRFGKSVKNAAKFCLCKTPRFYGFIERLRPHGSIDKRVFLALISSGNVVCDIGANTGHYTLIFSNVVGSGGEVHAFEPVPSTFARLRSEVEASAWHRNIRLNSVAMSDSIGNALMHMPGDDHGQASLARHDQGSWREGAVVSTFECKQSTLDEYARNLTRRIDFIKIDVEGAELMVLKGANSTLRKDLPTIFFEVSVDWCKGFGYTPEDVVNYLRSCGYTEFHAVTTRVFKLEDGVPPPQSGNIVASCRKLKALL
jgi:FkbM family methyltransferase